MTASLIEAGENSQLNDQIKSIDGLNWEFHDNEKCVTGKVKVSGKEAEYKNENIRRHIEAW